MKNRIKRKQPKRKQQKSQPKQKGKGAFQSLGNSTWVPDGIRSFTGKVGKGIDKFFSTISGPGDYLVKSNSILDAPINFGAPKSIRIRNREMCQTVRQAGTATSGGIQPQAPFSYDRYSINPSNKALFPWLSSLVSNYSEYRIHGMIFEYKSLITPITTSVLGQNIVPAGEIIIATQYDPNQLGFVNSEAMLNNFFVSRCKGFENTIHAVECASSQTPLDQLYCSPQFSDRQYLSEIKDLPVAGAIQAFVGDRRFNTYGILNVARKGFSNSGPADASVALGELWISYDIELFKPKTKEAPISPTHFQITGMVTNLPLGTSFVKDYGDVSVDLNTTTQTLTIQPQQTDRQYMINYMTKGTVSANGTLALALTSCSYYNDYFADVDHVTQCFEATHVAVNFSITVLAGSTASIVLSNGSVFAGTQTVDLFVHPLNTLF